jgi:hypothetical protein
VGVGRNKNVKISKKEASEIALKNGVQRAIDVFHPKKK